MASKYRWNESTYDDIFRVCTGLTNAKILCHSLREEGHESFVKHENRILTIGDSVARKSKQAQIRYR